MSDKISRFLLLSLIFLTLFVTTTDDYLIIGLTGGLVCGFLIYLFWQKEIFFPSVLNGPALIFIGYSLISLGTTANFHSTLLTILKFITYFLLFFVLQNICSSDDKKKLENFVFLILLIAVIRGSFQFYQSGAISMVPNNNIFSSFLNICILISLNRLVDERFIPGKPELLGRVLKLTLIILAMALVFFTLSRGGIISLLAGIIILFYLKKLKSIGWIIISGLLIFSLIPLGNQQPLGKRMIARLKSDPNVWERIVLWQDVGKYIADRPLLGSGWGTFNDYYPQYKSLPGFKTAAYAHNEYLHLIAEGGGVGFALWLWLLAILGFYLYKNRTSHPEYFAVFAAVLLQAGVDFNLHSYSVVIPLVFFAGLFLPKNEPVMLNKYLRWTLLVFILPLFYLFFSLGWGFRECLTAVKYSRQNQAEQAFSQMKKAMLWDPVFALYHKELADFYRDRNDLKNYQNELRLAISLEPRNVWYLRKFALFCSEYQEWNSAVDLFQRIILLAPNAPMFRNELADVYLAAGKPKEAQKELTVALQLAPDNRLIKEKLRSIK
ncbi:MAG: O-antigen ligase family protein [Elusimicrobiota bacterium]